MIIAIGIIGIGVIFLGVMLFKIIQINKDIKLIEADIDLINMAHTLPPEEFWQLFRDNLHSNNQYKRETSATMLSWIGE